MIYQIKNNLPILLEWKDKKSFSLSTEPNYSCCHYDFNDYGYRSIHNYEPILDDENKIICIGCSFTFGIGLDEEQTWPFKLSKLLNCNFLNLGFPGGSIKYVLWQIYNVYQKIPNKQIFVLTPPMGREFELSDKNFTNHVGKQGVNESEFDNFLIDKICNQLNIIRINYNFFGYNGDSTIDLGIAKDGVHYGETYQNGITNEFFKKYIAK